MSTDTREALAALRAIVALDDDGVLTLVSDQAQSYHTDFVLALQNARAALATQPAQPSAQGEAVAWKRVPVEPTEAMVKAGEEADDDNIAATPYYAATAIYRAMLASAPAAPASAQGEAVAHPSHQTVRDWMPVNEALRLADVWSVGDLDNCGQWRAAIKVLADEVRALASAPAAQPSAQGEAVAWLVEWKAHGHGPQWWGFNHTPGKNATWCSDANNAIRFARKEDAERMRLHVIAVAGLTGMHSYERSVSVTEHLWEGYCRAA